MYDTTIAIFIRILLPKKFDTLKKDIIWRDHNGARTRDFEISRLHYGAFVRRSPTIFQLIYMVPCGCRRLQHNDLTNRKSPPLPYFRIVSSHLWVKAPIHGCADPLSFIHPTHRGARATRDEASDGAREVTNDRDDALIVRIAVIVRIGRPRCAEKEERRSGEGRR